MEAKPLDPEVLALLICPETRSALHHADAPMIADLNARIARGEVRNREGKPVQEPLDGGLLRADGLWLYPIQDGIPILLIEESIATSKGS